MKPATWRFGDSDNMVKLRAFLRAGALSLGLLTAAGIPAYLYWRRHR